MGLTFEEDYIRLSELPINKGAFVHEVFVGKGLKERLMDMGIFSGIEIKK